MYTLKMKSVNCKGHKSNRTLMRFFSLDRAIKMLNSMANEELVYASEFTEHACLTVLDDGGIQVRTGKRSKRIFRVIEEGS